MDEDKKKPSDSPTDTTAVDKAANASPKSVDPEVIKEKVEEIKKAAQEVKEVKESTPETPIPKSLKLIKLSNKSIVDQLNAVQQAKKNEITKPDEVKNDWTHLKFTRNPWYYVCLVVMFFMTCAIGFEIALLADEQEIWGVADVHMASLYSLLFTFGISAVTLICYLAVTNNGKEKTKYNDVAYKNGQVYKTVNSVPRKTYWLSNYSLFILLLTFFMFYGFVTDATKIGTSRLSTLSAILSILTIMIPAIAIPNAVKNITKHNNEKKTSDKFHEWVRLNIESKYALLKNINFDQKLNYLELAKQLGIDTNVLVIDEHITGVHDEKKIQENIKLYNDIKLMMLRDIFRTYEANWKVKNALYEMLGTTTSKSGRKHIKKTFKDYKIAQAIHDINRKNTILIQISYTFYKGKFE